MMSAGSPIANRTSLLLSLALTTACVHDAGAPAGAASVYQTRQGERIVITPSTIAIGTAVHPLVDCSDAETFCAASDEIGFRIFVPRRCPGFAWIPEDGPMQLESIWPHGGGARYVTRGGSPFIYDWQNNYGLVMLVYDPGSDFAVRGARYPRGTPALYEHKSGPRPFACH
jgi:hypothetical protein